MPLFNYKALGSNGKVMTGEIDAADRPDALRVLDRRGLQPVSLREASGPVAQAAVKGKGRPEPVAMAAGDSEAKKADPEVPPGPVKLKRADVVMFTMGVDLPIWRSSYAAGVREAEKMKAASEAAQVAAARQSSFDVQDASFKLQTARRTLELDRQDLIPQAEARFRASETDYQTGKVDFMDLLESQRFLLNARIMTAMEEGTLGMQAARLERAVGVELATVAPTANETAK